MLSTAAVFLSAAALWVVAVLDGDVLLGWAAVLTALAAVIGALGTSIASLRKTSQVARAVGPPNGSSLQAQVSVVKAIADETKTVVERIDGFKDYQADRNHQIINALTPLMAEQPTLIHLIELLVERLGDTHQVQERLVELIGHLAPKED